MDRTSLGLQRVPAGESIFDGFTTVDRDTIDRLLRIGALLHRHDAHAALPAPTFGPDIVIEATGGALPAGSDFYAAVTALDAAGGETVLSPVNLGAIPLPLLDVPQAPTAVVDYTAGTLPPNTYYYVVTVTDDSGGESEASDPVEATVIPGAANARVLLSGLTAIVDGAFGTGWRLYRSTNGGELGLLGQGLEPVDTFTDDGAPCLDPQLQPPVANTSGGTSKAVVTVAAGSLNAAAVGFRLYASPLPTFDEPSLVGTYDLSDLDTPIEVLDFGLQSGAPPAVSTALAGAAKITLAELADEVTAAMGGGGGGAGGTAFTTDDVFQWTDPNDTEPTTQIAGTLEVRSGWSSSGRGSTFHAEDPNPSPSIFDVGQPPTDFGGVNSYLVGKAGTSEAELHTPIGLIRPMTNLGYVEGGFLINDASAGWDKLGVGWGEVGDDSGIFAVLDRASGELQIVYRTAPGALTVLASAAYSGIADGAYPLVRLERSIPVPDGLSSGFTYHATVTVAKAVVAECEGTYNGFNGWTLWAKFLAGWTDPTSWSLDSVFETVNGPSRSVVLNLTAVDGSQHTLTLFDESGAVDTGADWSGPTRQKAGSVAADGTCDNAMVVKTGAGVYEVTYYGGLIDDGPPIIVTDPGGATLSNVSPVGFVADFGADTAFRYIAVSQP